MERRGKSHDERSDKQKGFALPGTLDGLYGDKNHYADMRRSSGALSCGLDLKVMR
jgi:hypothetical protein